MWVLGVTQTTTSKKPDVAADSLKKWKKEERDLEGK
jgi:hypothetical protein